MLPWQKYMFCFTGERLMEAQKTLKIQNLILSLFINLHFQPIILPQSHINFFLLWTQKENFWTIAYLAAHFNTTKADGNQDLSSSIKVLHTTRARYSRCLKIVQRLWVRNWSKLKQFNETFHSAITLKCHLHIFKYVVKRHQ